MVKFIDWNSALIEYMLDTNMSFAKVAKKYGVAKRTVAKHAIKGHWKLLRDNGWASAHQSLIKKESLQ